MADKGSWKSSDWTSYTSTHVAGKTRDAIFSRAMDKTLNPHGVKIRESRDSDVFPNSTALAIFLDQTGSMGDLADEMIHNGCNVLATEVYDRKVIPDPQILFGAIGDVANPGGTEEAPLQVTQFETDIRIAEQLQKFYLEGKGGGNDTESYTLPWYWASVHTELDCFIKRGKKGYLFTVGDECVPDILTSKQIERVLGYNPEKDFTAQELYNMVSRTYHVFHLMVEQGNFMSSYPSNVINSWTKILGQNAIPLSDHKKMSEVIVSIIQAREGVKKEEIIASWDGSTSVVVSKAIGSIVANANANDGVIEFI